MEFKLTQEYLQKRKKNRITIGILLSISSIILSLIVVIKSNYGTIESSQNILKVMFVLNLLFLITLWFILYRIVKVTWGKLIVNNSSLIFQSMYGEQVIDFDSIKRIDVTHRGNEVALINLITPQIHPGHINIKGYDLMKELVESLKTTFLKERIKEKRK